jgi:hypothetical protein
VLLQDWQPETANPATARKIIANLEAVEELEKHASPWLQLHAYLYVEVAKAGSQISDIRMSRRNDT